MGTFRMSRNIEASLIDALTTGLAADGFSGIHVIKVFKQVYGGKFPSILVNVSNNPSTMREIGSSTLFDDREVTFRIFAESDGQRLDLADWLTEEILANITYKTYTTVNGVATGTSAGKICTVRITENKKELANSEKVAEKDRFRHIIRADIRVQLS